ncbi:MAG TPA: hypothetical protein VEB20_08110 [Azospirillaceae bacterium]|nr:hypothetical protein [Azospirillaceae bacterium]
MTRPLLPAAAVASLAGVLLLGAAAGTALAEARRPQLLQSADPVPAAQKADPRLAEYECAVDSTAPCKGRVDFERGRSYAFRIAGPGTASFANEGNRRCVLEYSATESTSASTGRTLDLPPGQVLTLPVKDAQGLMVRFFNRGYGSLKCDLAVTLGS